MAEPRVPVGVLIIVAAFSRHGELLEEARRKLEEMFGPIALASVPYVFDQTCYYERTMGADLRKQLWAFTETIDPDRLPAIKLAANALERELAGRHPEPRPINLDP